MLLDFIASQPLRRAAAWPLCLLVLTAVVPVYARTINFAGYTWDVRDRPGGPGPNVWSDDTDDVWVDGAGRLHLTFKADDGVWSATEVISTQSFGYGEYRWKINTNVENFDKNVVLGLFTYEDDTREIDIEFAKWAEENNSLGNFTKQGTPFVTDTFDVDLNGDFSTHLFTWAPGYIEWASIHGHTDDDALPGFTIGEYRYDGSGIPPDTADDRVHMNLWGFRGMAPSDGQSVEVIISDFDFIPLPEPGSLALMSLTVLGLRRRRVSRG